LGLAVKLVPERIMRVRFGGHPGDTVTVSDPVSVIEKKEGALGVQVETPERFSSFEWRLDNVPRPGQDGGLFAINLLALEKGRHRLIVSAGGSSLDGRRFSKELVFRVKD
jgi:hypothetical protein